jgi:hypothetical protein
MEVAVHGEDRVCAALKIFDGVCKKKKGLDITEELLDVSDTLWYKFHVLVLVQSIFSVGHVR